MTRYGTLVATAVLAATAAAPALAYDGFETDFATCTQGSGKVSNAEIVKACSRLINNAQAENETVGFFYALRGSANTDKASNCRDAKKAIQLLKAPGVVEAAKQLAQNNC
jgi:hypothetical protein